MTNVATLHGTRLNSKQGRLNAFARKWQGTVPVCAMNISYNRLCGKSSIEIISLRQKEIVFCMVDSAVSTRCSHHGFGCTIQFGFCIPRQHSWVFLEIDLSGPPLPWQVFNSVGNLSLVQQLGDGCIYYSHSLCYPSLTFSALILPKTLAGSTADFGGMHAACLATD